MSRSYRLRHYPKLPGTAHKFVVGLGWHRKLKFDDELWRVVAHDILKLPCKDGKVPRERWWRHVNKHERTCIPDHLSKEAHALFDRLEDDHIYPVAGVWKHPWVGYRSAEVKCRKWYRDHAHRSARHRTKQLLNSLELDIESIHLPTMDDHFDSWAFD